MTDNHTVWNGRVEKDWVDYNGHMNDAAYAVVFSRALDKLLEDAGLTARFIEQEKYTVFTLETHLMYLAEAHQDQPLAVSAMILDQDAKRLHACLEALEAERRDMVRLAYLDGWSRADLATHFEQPVNTVKTWLHRALKQLKGCLAP